MKYSKQSQYPKHPCDYSFCPHFTRYLGYDALRRLTAREQGRAGIVSLRAGYYETERGAYHSGSDSLA